MTDQKFDRIADAFLEHGPIVLPDRVFDAAFEEVHRTRQRRVLWHLPWRFPTMNTFAKVAVAAVAVIAIGALGLTFLNPGVSGPGGASTATPTSTASPSASPSASVAVGPPPLTGQFTSDTHGISMAYPEGWEVRRATGPWNSAYVDFINETTDVVYEPSDPGKIWVAMVSQALGDRTPAEFEADVWQTVVEDDPEAAGCEASAEPITVDGAAGTTGCGFTIVTTGGRGYVLQGYASDDVPAKAAPYDEAWLASVLETVELLPEDAVDGS